MAFSYEKQMLLVLEVVPVSVHHINELSERDAEMALQRCCGSARWCKQMVAQRPFADLQQMISLADNVWWQLDSSDWLEAFSHHPQIGDVNILREKFASTKKWSEGEQASVNDADEAVLNRLSEGNRLYENRFGYIFIVCATGKSAPEMLALLEQRLNNSHEEEIRIAAGEQAKITKLRLEKLCQEVPSQPMS